MMRRTPMKRTGFKPRRPVHQPAVEREPRPMALAPAMRRGSYAGGTTTAAPKTEPHRHAHLLAMAKGMPCLLRIPDVCTSDRATTVACHSNEAAHGKAGARKADDEYTVWGCFACHAWLDQGRASAEEKREAFMEGHARMVQAWRGIVTFCPFLKDVQAARWALAQLGEDRDGLV